MPNAPIESVLIVNLKSLPTWHLDLADGFRQLGIDAQIYLTTPQTLAERAQKSLRGAKWYRSPLFLRRLVETARATRPDVIIFLGMFVLPRATVAALEAGLGERPRLVGWVCDCFREPQFDDWVVADHVFYFDSFLETMLAGVYPERSRTTYLPLAANPARYRPLTASAKRDELIFVGNVSPNRRALLDALAHEIPLVVRGPNAGRQRYRRRRKLDSETINRQYNAHRVVLNINQSPNTEHGLNLRAFEVAAAGAVLLTQDCADLPRNYAVGSEVLSYRDSAELVASYRELIADPARAAAIAAAGLARTRRDHTFVNRARSMLAALAA